MQSAKKKKPDNQPHSIQTKKKTHLTGNGDLLTILKSYRTVRPIRVVKHDGNAGFCYPCLPPFINKLLLILRAHLQHTHTTNISREKDDIPNNAI